jgi:hypothetical protein
VNPVFFGGLWAVACPTASQCTAVEEHDREVTFDPTAPGSPMPTPLDEAPVNAVECPSSALCTAVDSSGWEVTFDPNLPGSAVRVAIDSGGVVTTTTTVSSGIAQAAGSARVRLGVATIKLACTGLGACTGTIGLLARVARTRSASDHGRRPTVRRAHNVAIGTASFSVVKGAGVIVRVHLSRRGEEMVLQAGRQGLIVRLSGTDVKSRSLVLKRSKP